MEDFSSFFKAASNLKSANLAKEKKLFDALPEYSKVGLYCSDKFSNVRKQKFKLKRF